VPVTNASTEVKDDGDDNILQKVPVANTFELEKKEEKDEFEEVLDSTLHKIVDFSNP
jgi:hypothetical protein